MGQISIAYGAILGSRWSTTEPTLLQIRNLKVIEQLPSTDTWPFLTREMFALAGTNPESGHYRQQVIHFGASFKCLEWEWAEWLGKFEDLLSKLFWDEVMLHLHTEAIGHYDYYYESLIPLSFYAQTPFTPNQEWQLIGGPRYFDYHDHAKCLEQDGKTWRYSKGEWSLVLD